MCCFFASLLFFFPVFFSLCLLLRFPVGVCFSVFLLFCYFFFFAFCFSFLLFLRFFVSLCFASLFFCFSVVCLSFFVHCFVCFRSFLLSTHSLFVLLDYKCSYNYMKNSTSSTNNKSSKYKRNNKNNKSNKSNKS